MEHSRLSELKEPLAGSHIVTPRLGYRHHGLYCGDGKVIHFSGMAHFPHWKQLRLWPRLLRMSRIEEISLRQFCNGYGYKVLSHGHARYNPDEVVLRARSRLGERGYATLSNNCEHFVNWCVEGEPRSWLVWRMTLLIGLTVGGLRALSWIRVRSGSARPLRVLVSSGLVSLCGALAMGALSLLSLRPARTLEPEELSRRVHGRRGVWLGVVIGVLVSMLGLRTRMRGMALMGPFLMPTLIGLGCYLLRRPSALTGKKLN